MTLPSLLADVFAYSVWPWVGVTLLAQAALLSLTARFVAWTCHSEIDRYLLMHLPEAAQHEVWARDQEIARLREQLAAARAEIADHRGVVRLFTRAAEKAREVTR